MKSPVANSVVNLIGFDNDVGLVDDGDNNTLIMIVAILCYVDIV